ncbi:MAG TPA: acyltransferase [Cytophagaceae bacterium]|jgi:peptidoglycan/LPS O-acetylase OafA/YrhL|nr:acyltransferase [Cytophagaceae bacterium]
MKRRIEVLDYGRFFAALFVLLQHYFYNGIHNGKITSITYTPFFSNFFKLGYAGVSFFFIISGYVIFYSSLNKSASEFVKSRFLRLYPAYWMSILFSSVFLFLWSQGTSMSVSFFQFVVNLTMLQEFFGVKNIDGVYWTLFLELKFYIAVAIILFFAGSKKLILFFKCWPVLILVFHILNFEKSIFHMQFAFFSFGTLIAIYRNDKRLSSLLPLLVACILCFMQINVKATTPFESYILYGCMFVFVIFFTSLNFESVRNIKLFKSELLGALTYPLYLIHAHFGYAFLSKFATDNNKWILYPVLILIVLTVAYTIHLFIEKKLKSFWNSFFEKAVTPLSKLEYYFSAVKNKS